MKRLLAVLTAFALMLCISAALTEDASGKIRLTNKISAHFATVEEGQQLMRDRTLFHNQISEDTLPFYLQRKGGTISEYIDYSAEQVIAFTVAEELRIKDVLSWLHDQLEKHNLQLPDPGEITFVKSTNEEILGSAGYTSGGTIFLNYLVYEPGLYTHETFRELILHEIFHCLTRLYPEFRRAMYSLIHFTVLDQDISIPEEIRRQIIANPDVEHHNSYATFTIGGEKKGCYLVFLTDSVFEKHGDDFFAGMYTGIVPMDGSKVYRIEEVEDFWDVVGRNTDYAEDPEEIIAVNFAYAVSRLDSGFADFKTPGILEGIIEYLKNL